MDKGMGLQKGRSDMVFYYLGKAYHIELKLEGEKQRPDQKLWQKTLETNGFTYKLIYSLQEFKDYINGIIITLVVKILILNKRNLNMEKERKLTIIQSIGLAIPVGLLFTYIILKIWSWL